MRFAWGRIREGARPKSGSFVADAAPADHPPRFPFPRPSLTHVQPSSLISGVMPERIPSDQPRTRFRRDRRQARFSSRRNSDRCAPERGCTHHAARNDHWDGACFSRDRIAVPIMNDRNWWQQDSGARYRELAMWLRDVARRCHLPNSQAELLSLARRYERRGEHLDRKARRSGARAAAG
jgi:hypothetical protein